MSIKTMADVKRLLEVNYGSIARFCRDRKMDLYQCRETLNNRRIHAKSIAIIAHALGIDPQVLFEIAEREKKAS